MSGSLDLRKTLEDARRAILARIKSHITTPDIDQLKASDLTFRGVPNPGGSRATYIVSAKEHQFVLSINVPRNAARMTRGDINDVYFFRQHLSNKKIPVAEPVGTPFQVGDYSCELAEFVHGYQLPKSEHLTDVELRSFAKTVADFHKHAQGFSPISTPSSRTSRKLTFSRLPQGFIHSDMKTGNLIFNSDTHKVKAVLDFEFGHYNTFAHDLAMSISQSFMRYEIKGEKVDFKIDSERANRFLKYYCMERKLTSKEADAINRGIFNRIKEDLTYRNEKAGNPITPEGLEQELQSIAQQIQQRFHARQACKDGLVQRF